MVKMVQGKKNIVILGAGFAGLRIAQDLAAKLTNSAYQIVLVDKNDVHLYTPDLYEIAAAFNSKITRECLLALKETVATPISGLLNQKIHFVRDEVMSINTDNQSVTLKKHGKMDYFVLSVCLGSATNYFNIPGLQQNAHPVKTIQDALALNYHLDMLFQEVWRKKNKKEINIVVGGGGATGVEVAGELVGCTKKLCLKYQLADCKVRINLVEAGHMLAAMDKKGTGIVKKTLLKQGVKILLGHKITKVDHTSCRLENEKQQIIKQDCDVMIWTGGVMINPVVSSSLGDDACRGAIRVGKSLKAENHKNIFAAGDNAFCLDDKTGQRIPMLAQVAMHQGEILAKNIVSHLHHQPLKNYYRKGEIYLIPVGSKCLLKVGERVFLSRLFLILKRLVAFRYFASVMPWWEALKKAWRGGEIFLQND